MQYFRSAFPAPIMHADSLPILWCYINDLQNYLLTHTPVITATSSEFEENQTQHENWKEQILSNKQMDPQK